MPSFAHKARLGRGTQNGVIQAWFAGNGVPQVELLIRVLAGLVRILEVLSTAALALDHAHQEEDEWSQPQTGAGWPHAKGKTKMKHQKHANCINCDICERRFATLYSLG